MRKLNKSTLFLLLILASSFTSHKFYVSLIQIDYSAKEHTYQTSIKVFIDDMKKALGDGWEIPKQANDSLNKALFNYSSDHLNLKHNGKEIQWKWVGYELEEDVVWIYLESPALSAKPKKIDIHCTNLINLFDDQVNIIQVKVDKERKSKSLTKSDTNCSFEF